MTEIIRSSRISQTNWKKIDKVKTIEENEKQIVEMQTLQLTMWMMNVWKL